MPTAAIHLQSDQAPADALSRFQDSDAEARISQHACCHDTRHASSNNDDIILFLSNRCGFNLGCGHRSSAVGSDGETGGKHQPKSHTTPAQSVRH